MENRTAVLQGWFALWFVFFLCWLVWLSAGIPAHGYTWRDVYLKWKETSLGDGPTCKTWVEEYNAAPPYGYRVWQRCSTRGTNGIKTSRNTYSFPSGQTLQCSPPTNPGPGSSYKCDATSITENHYVGQSFYGGGYASNNQSGQTCVYQSGAGSFGSVGIDCMGIVTNGQTQQTFGYTGLQAWCPIDNTSNGGVNCNQMDVLAPDGDFGTGLEWGQCQPRITVTRNGKNWVGVGGCSCIPDYMVPTAKSVAFNGTASCTFASVVGDISAGSNPYASKGQSNPTGGDPGTGTASQPGDTSCELSEGCGAAGGGTVPTQSGTGTGGSSGSGTNTGGGSSTMVSGGGTGGAVIVQGPGPGGSVPVSGAGTGDSVKTDIQEDAKNDNGASIPGDSTFSPFGTGDLPQEQDWKQMIVDYIASNPVSTALNATGQVVTTGATCSFTAQIWGHDITYSMCPYETVLQLLGGMILAMAGIYSVWIIAVGA